MFTKNKQYCLLKLQKPYQIINFIYYIEQVHRILFLLTYLIICRNFKCVRESPKKSIS
jgi:hypothetical protein